jgi:hypothetical protein
MMPTTILPVVVPLLVVTGCNGTTSGADDETKQMRMRNGDA